MSLRYDLTAPLARHVAENFNEIQLPYAPIAPATCFATKPGPRRFRQFMQFDADTSARPAPGDAEMCMMMADTLEALGIQRGDYVIRVNNRRFDGVPRRSILRTQGGPAAERAAAFMLDKFGPAGVALLRSAAG